MSSGGAEAPNGMRYVRLMIEFDPEAELDNTEPIGRQLRSELAELDVQDVTAAPSVEARPDGAKGAGVDWGTLLLTLSASGGVFAAVVATIRDWLARSHLAHRITMTIDGDSIDVYATSTAEHNALIDTWIRRHGAR